MHTGSANVDKLADRVAIVTGGASGIGRAIAERFAQDGARVVIADYNAQGAEEAADSLKTVGYGALAVQTNVADSKSVQAMIDATMQAFGRLDILVNSAGTGENPGPVHEKDEDDWQRVMAVNATGTFLCMKYVIPHMLARQSGVIINVASVAGVIGFAHNAAYAASKGAVIQLTRAAALEYARYGIRVNAIAPGWVQTPMVDRFVDSGVPADRLIRSMPIGRLGTAEEIAALVAFLASDESSLLIGSTVVIDGGLTIA
jgi:NAD(P)-dependent dehydrogenase (short-subunit alcohol dehydrogenase family)